MTREDAIKFLKGYLDEEVYTDKCRTAHNMAIKALEQEPCEDAVSREQTLLALTGKNLSAKSAEELIRLFNKRIKTLPPVEPTRKWIPCSEKLPEEEVKVLVCNANGDIEISMGSWSTELENHFDWYTSGWRFGKVIAWKPLPDPYKASEEFGKYDCANCRHDGFVCDECKNGSKYKR